MMQTVDDVWKPRTWTPSTAGTAGRDVSRAAEGERQPVRRRAESRKMRNLSSERVGHKRSTEKGGSMRRLEGSVALVTGGASRIGRATAEPLRTRERSSS